MPLARNQAITIRRSFELEIESVNRRVYDTLNNGVYKAGFATSQTAYEEAVEPLFKTLDWLELRLASARYLVGNRLTEGTFACSSHSYASTRSTTGTLSATCGVSSIIPIYGPTRAISFRRWELT